MLRIPRRRFEDTEKFKLLFQVLAYFLNSVSNFQRLESNRKMLFTHEKLISRALIYERSDLAYQKREFLEIFFHFF